MTTCSRITLLGLALVFCGCGGGESSRPPQTGGERRLAPAGPQYGPFRPNPPRSRSRTSPARPTDDSYEEMRYRRQADQRWEQGR